MLSALCLLSRVSSPWRERCRWGAGQRPLSRLVWQQRSYVGLWSRTRAVGTQVLSGNTKHAEQLPSAGGRRACVPSVLHHEEKAGP